MGQKQISILQIKITFLLKLNDKIYCYSQLNMIPRILLMSLKFLNFQLKVFKLMIAQMVLSHKVVNLILLDFKKSNLLSSLLNI